MPRQTRPAWGWSRSGWIGPPTRADGTPIRLTPHHCEALCLAAGLAADDAARVGWTAPASDDTVATPRDRFLYEVLTWCAHWPDLHARERERPRPNQQRVAVDTILGLATELLQRLHDVDDETRERLTQPVALPHGVYRPRARWDVLVGELEALHRDAMAAWQSAAGEESRGSTGEAGRRELLFHLCAVFAAFATTEAKAAPARRRDYVRAACAVAGCSLPEDEDKLAALLPPPELFPQ